MKVAKITYSELNKRDKPPILATARKLINKPFNISLIELDFDNEMVCISTDEGYIVYFKFENILFLDFNVYYSRCK